MGTGMGRTAAASMPAVASPAVATPVRPGPIPSLDGLRAVAVLIVVVAHGGYGDVIPGGLGVTIFFFLSGFLITTLLLDEQRGQGSINVGHFYLRRAYRLLPPLFITLAIAYSLVGLDLLGGGTSWAGLSSQVFYFANYYATFLDPGDSIPDGTGILWSLAVEEHFYIIYPALMYVLVRLANSQRVLLGLFTGLCVVALLWRVWLVSQSDFVFVRTYYASDTRFDSILFGCLLALWQNPVRRAPSEGDEREAMRPVDWALLSAGVTLLLATVGYRQADFRETFRYTLQGIALMPIFYYAIRYSTVGPFRLLNTRWLMRLGVLSYGIYLSHYVILETLIQNASVAIPAPARVLIVLALSAGFAALLDAIVDPFFRRRRAALH